MLFILLVPWHYLEATTIMFIPEGSLCKTHIFPVRYISILLDLETISIALTLCLEATGNNKSQKQKQGDGGPPQTVTRIGVSYITRGKTIS